MSRVVPLSSLSADCQKLIQSLLNIKVEKSFTASKYAREDTWMQAFAVFGNREGGDARVRLPFAFAGILGIPVCPLSESRDSLPAPTTRKFEWKEGQSQVYKEAIQHLQKYNTVTLNLGTGKGKTVLGSIISCTMFPLADSVIVLVHRLNLLNNWETDFKALTTVTTWIVDDKPPTQRPHVIISMIDSVEKIPLEWRKKCILLIDEAHRMVSKGRFKHLLEIMPWYVIALTATTNKSDGLYNAMWAVTGKQSLIVREQDKKHIVVRYLTGFECDIPVNNRGMPDWNALVKLCDSNEIRTQRLVSLVLALEGQKVLIVVRQKKYGLPDRLRKFFADAGKKVSVFSAGEKKYQDADIIISILGKISDGFDEKSTALDFTGNRISAVVLWNSIRDQLTLEQVIGRGFRSESPMIIFAEDNNKISHRHWLECKKWFVAHGAEIAEQREDPIPKEVVCFNSAGEKMIVTGS